MKQWPILLCAVWCAQTLQAQVLKPFLVTGTCMPDGAEKVYLTYHNGNALVKDSALVVSDKYRMKGKITEPAVAVVALKRKTWSMPLPADELRILLIPGDTVKIFSKEEIFTRHHIKGSSQQALLDTLVKWEKGHAFREGSVSIAAELAARNGDSMRHHYLRTYYDSVHNGGADAVYGRFIEAHPQSPVALYALGKMMAAQMNPDRTQQLWHSLSPGVQKLPTAVRLKKEIVAARRTAVGAYAPNFTQTDTAGQSLSLSAFKGKWVLVDFWASWCGPCRRENPNVLRAYEKYKSRNFTVLGVSLDEKENRGAWIKAVREDGLVWTQVMDTQHAYNYAAQLYRIAFIPQNILINPQGRIAAKNLKGAALHAWLEKLLPPADATQPF